MKKALCIHLRKFHRSSRRHVFYSISRLTWKSPSWSTLKATLGNLPKLEPQPASVNLREAGSDRRRWSPSPAPTPTLLIGAANPACSIRTIIVLLVLMSCFVVVCFCFPPHYAHLFPLFLSFNFLSETFLLL